MREQVLAIIEKNSRINIKELAVILGEIGRASCRERVSSPV